MSKKTDDAILEAIKDSGGIMSTIARKLGVTWHTADSWIRDSGELMEALKDEKETILDMAESTLLKRIKEGDEQSAKWYLSKIGKLRGYGDSVAIEGGIQIVYADKDDERL
jgi:transposase-like protein